MKKSPDIITSIIEDKNLYRKIQTKNWYKKVYHPKKYGWNKGKTKKWLKTRSFILSRDNYVCQMCKESFGDLSLEVHHIKPRKSGGKDNSANLITLCRPCHDITEIAGLSKKEIIFYKKDREIMILKKQEGLRWQQWVYGGYKRPGS